MRPTPKADADKLRRAEIIPTAGEIFPDGAAVELIRDSDGSLKFLACDGSAANIVDQYTRGETVYEPLQVHRSIRDALVLPADRAEFGCTRQLFNEIEALILRASGGSEGVAKPLTFLVFASWLVESALVAPFIWVVSASNSSSVALEQMLRLLCRHVLVVKPLGANWPSALPMAIRPTLISTIDKPTQHVVDLLRASQTHGLYWTRAGAAVDPFCAKVIFSRQPLEDPAAAGFPLEIVLAPDRKFVAPLDESQAMRIAAEFQNKLLAYRVANSPKMVPLPPKIDMNHIGASAQALAHTLGGAIVGDEELQREILTYLEKLDADLQTAPTSMIDVAIAQALIAWRHNGEVAVAEIAGDVNTILAARGISIVLSPENVGWKLRRLGLHTVHNSQGLKVLRVPEAWAAIEKIAAVYGVTVPKGDKAAD